MASTVRSRRRATAIAVPGTVAVLLAGAYVATPALAATSSTSTSLPFPSVCPTEQSASSGTGTGTTSTTSSSPSTSSGSASSSPSTESSSASASPTPTATASANASTSASAAANVAVGGGSPSATPSTSATNSATASASASASSSSGFWGWLNGVWTWIFSDSEQSDTAQSSAQDAVAPLSAAHVVEAADGVGAQAEATASAAATCIPAAEASSLAAAASASPSEGVTASTIPWVMKTPELTMWNLTYNGVKSLQVWDPTSQKYVDENVLDFTASEIDIQSMVTYSIQNEQTVFNDAGSGTTTKLTNVHLMVTKMTADLYGLIGQTYDPDNQPPLPVGFTIPLIPVIFTNVTTTIAYLHTDGIAIPGFNGFASTGVASPE